MWTKVGFLALLTSLTISTGAFAADIVRPKPVLVVPQPPPVSGYLGIYIGETWWNNHGGTDCAIPDSCPQPRSDNNFLFGGDARANWFASPGMSLQFDTQGEATTRYKGAHPDPEDIDADGRINGLAGLHISWRDARH